MSLIGNKILAHSRALFVARDTLFHNTQESSDRKADTAYICAAINSWESRGGLLLFPKCCISFLCLPTPTLLPSNPKDLNNLMYNV